MRDSRLRLHAALPVTLAVVCGGCAQAVCLWLGGKEGAQQKAARCPESGFVQWSSSDRSSAFAVGLRWPWNDAPGIRTSRLSWKIEATVGVWRSFGAGGTDERPVSLQLGLTPAAVWAFRSGWFLEAGVGLNAVAPRYRAGNRRFGTRLNFGDHVAWGLRFGEGQRHVLQLRVEHFSNAGLRKPNPGEDFAQIRYAWRFD